MVHFSCQLSNCKKKNKEIKANTSSSRYQLRNSHSSSSDCGGQYTTEFHTTSLPYFIDIVFILGSEDSFAECRRSDDGSPVNEEKCDAGLRPPRATAHCNFQPCPPV